MSMIIKKQSASHAVRQIDARPARRARRDRRMPYPQPVGAYPDDHLIFFRCEWFGDANLLLRRISERVAWGPFEVALVPDDLRPMPQLSVQYLGPARERNVLMKSFWKQVRLVAPLVPSEANDGNLR